ncbi:MAG: alpha/beta fold hydrolase [Anaerolineaceae bacterium]|nr:alpha/beta fold hydrolase [Anaerolineaceae bacterium]
MKSLFKKEAAVKILCIALVLIFISGLGSMLAETNGRRVKITDYRMTWAEMAGEITANAAKNGKDVEVTFDGSNGSMDLSASSYRLGFKLLVPSTATASNPAPAVVTTHGFFNNKEMQDSFYTELARRGFVVISLDSPGHGSSDPDFPADANIMVAVENTGAEACVEWLASQDYVDETRIGLTGHSMGSIGNVYAIINLANAGHADYVKSNLAQAQANSLPMLPAYLGAMPEGLQIGIIAARYDEFGMQRDDTYNYPTSANAIEIIKMADPSFSDSTVQMNTWYTADGIKTVDYTKGETIDDTAAIAYWEWISHPITHFSSKAAGDAVDFFYATLGIPSGADYISPDKCGVWFVKELFNLVGLIGFFMLIVPVATLLLKVPVFAKLIRSDEKGLVLADKNLPSFKPAATKVMFWVSGICIAILSAFLLTPLYIDPHFGNYLFPMTYRYPQETTNTIAMWVLFCGLITIGFMLLSWAVKAIANKKQGAVANPFAPAVLSGVGEFLNAMLFGLTVVVLLYVVVFAHYKIWGTDFRFWTLAVLKFDLEKIPVFARYLPFFLFFYVTNAISNVNNRFKEMPEWLSVLLTCVFNVGGYVLVWILQYSAMVNKGDYSYILVSDHSHAMFGSLGPLLLIPIFFTLIVAQICTRKLYKKTGNIWVPAAINGILYTVLICANTFTQLAYAFA